jgi:DNA replication protein DnaC
MTPWLEDCGIGERYWGATRERLREPGVIGAYLDDLGDQVNQGRGLVLLGGIGVGKTSALALIAKQARGIVRDGVWYVTVTRLISHLLRGSGMKTRRNTYGVETGQPYEVDPKLFPLLLLDEFGAAYESDYAMAAFEDYIGVRYDKRLATCVAANLTPEQILANPHYARMVDRWRETCRVVVIGGESMREAQA